VAEVTFTEQRRRVRDIERERERERERWEKERNQGSKEKKNSMNTGRMGWGGWLGENAVKLVRRYLYTPECPMNQDS